MSMSPARRLQDLDMVGLSLEHVFSSELGASRLQIQPAEQGCFEELDWYAMQQPLDISHEDFELIEILTSANSTSAAASSPRGLSRVAVQPACFKDCAGRLTGACREGELGTAEAASYTFAPTATEPTTLGGYMLSRSAGEDVFDDFFSETDGLWGWLLAVSLAALLLPLGFIVSMAYICRAAPEKTYDGMETVRLVYEGENGDEEVLLTRNGPNLVSSMGTQPGLLNASYAPMASKGGIFKTGGTFR